MILTISFDFIFVFYIFFFNKDLNQKRYTKYKQNEEPDILIIKLIF